MWATTVSLEIVVHSKFSLPIPASMSLPKLLTQVILPNCFFPGVKQLCQSNLILRVLKGSKKRLPQSKEAQDTRLEALRSSQLPIILFYYMPDTEL